MALIDFSDDDIVPWPTIPGFTRDDGGFGGGFSDENISPWPVPGPPDDDSGFGGGGELIGAAITIASYLGLVANIATITQAILMIAEKRSKKAREEKTNSKNVSKESDKIRTIHILMSDGSRIRFESWHDDPEKVKEFIKLLHSSSPKPVRVEFILNNLSKIPVNISDNITDQEKVLDEIIKYLEA